MKRILAWLVPGSALAAVLAFVALNQLSWQFHHDWGILKRIPPSDLALAWRRSGEPACFSSGELTICGDLYRPSGAPPHPAILLVHGSTPFGRKLAPYPLLADKLAERGHVVLSIDVRGFGESDDPLRLDSESAIDAVPDLLAGAEYLAADVSVDPQRIFVVGHSMGAGLAMRAAPRSTVIRKVVAISPPRRTLERAEHEMNGLRLRFSHDRRLHGEVPAVLFAEVARGWAIERLAGYYGSTAHVPLLLLDGELEEPADQEFLHAYFGTLSPPKAYRTIPGTGHYLGSVNFFGGPLIFHSEPLVEEVVSVIDGWLRADEDSLPYEVELNVPPTIVKEPAPAAPPQPIRADAFAG
jgi:pimeloyl-ACP methyl ester carboxylesterase